MAQICQKNYLWIVSECLFISQSEAIKLWVFPFVWKICFSDLAARKCFYISDNDDAGLHYTCDYRCWPCHSRFCQLNFSTHVRLCGSLCQHCRFRIRIWSPLNRLWTVGVILIFNIQNIVQNSYEHSAQKIDCDVGRVSLRAVLLKLHIPQLGANILWAWLLIMYLCGNVGSYLDAPRCCLQTIS